MYVGCITRNPKQEDQPWGKGSMTYANKDMYVGSWVCGVRDGEGKLVWADGAWYQVTVTP